MPSDNPADRTVRLQQWYESQCDGQWEHAYGVSIESLDNPGWLVRIDLRGSPAEGKKYSEEAFGLLDGNLTATRWYEIKVVENVFEAAGSDLPFLMDRFFQWIGQFEDDDTVPIQ
ncbi:MAG: immunity 53 family protein [Planctomycetota bacterium]